MVSIPDSGDGGHAQPVMGSSVPFADENGMSDQAVVRAMVEGGRMAALGELTAGAAHEINNPLFAILTLVEFLLRDAEPETKAFERLQLVQGSAKDIQAVVERVHHFARERGGKDEPVALEEAVRGAADLVQRTSATRSVEIVERYPTEPALVAGDSAQLKCLFVHLLMNALQAMPDGGALTVQVEHVGGEILGRVQDEGPGIPAADVERVFDLFFTTRNGSGTGLGLAAARAIAELHGGTLGVEPNDEPGACFVLRLPKATV
jgi:signal transduction histidine kinase